MKFIIVTLLVVASFSLGYYFFKPTDCQAQGCDTKPMLTTVLPQEFNSKLTSAADPVLLDIRTVDEFSQGHIANAINQDFYQAQDFDTKLDSLDKNSQYFIYCRSGNRSGQALQLMRQKGFTNVTNLDGGIVAWQAMYPVVK